VDEAVAVLQQGVDIIAPAFPDSPELGELHNQSALLQFFQVRAPLAWGPMVVGGRSSVAEQRMGWRRGQRRAEPRAPQPGALGHQHPPPLRMGAAAGAVARQQQPPPPPPPPPPGDCCMLTHRRERANTWLGTSRLQQGPMRPE
jgi:hypothetical protein